jgi:hypothetical protein
LTNKILLYHLIIIIIIILVHKMRCGAIVWKIYLAVVEKEVAIFCLYLRSGRK